MMKVALVPVVLACIACAAGPRPAAAPQGPPQDRPHTERSLPIPADLAPRIQESIELGRTLYLLDKASAIGTDVAKEKVPDLHQRGVGGWLTTRAADETGKPTDAFGVLFITKDEPFRVLFRIDVPLRGEHQADEMVFGIHYRVLVSEDGTTIKHALPLSKSALVIGPHGDIPPGAKPVAAVVSQIVTDWPLETHVFVSLLHDRAPIYVVTRRGVWLVIGDKVSLVDDKPPAPG